MKSILLAVAATCLISVGLTGCKSSSGGADVTSSAAPACAACAAGKGGQTVWCEQCNAGFVEGKKTSCKACYMQAKGGPACTICAKK